MSAIVLPANMDKTTLPPLAREMMELCDKGEALEVDGSKVTRVGLAGIQLLASAALSARDRDVAFTLTNPSDELVGASSLCGLNAMFGIAA